MALLVLLSLLSVFVRINGQFMLSFATPAPVAPSGGVDPNCKDQLDSCWNFPESSCKAPYEDWARDYCANRCGYCTGPTTPSPPCVDKLPNCEKYDKSVCTSADYRTWAQDNCRGFCRHEMCSPAEAARIDAMTTTVAPADCMDKVDCRSYGPNACSEPFKAWSQDNCALHCGYCTGLPTPAPACQDAIPNCQEYDADTCTNVAYKMWVEDNCRKHCGLCGSTGSSGPATPAPPMPTNRYPVPPQPGTDTQTIAYVPPTPRPIYVTPPSGKRSIHEHPIVRRQFHASHHHQGGVHNCWDADGKFLSDDEFCQTTAPISSGIPVAPTTASQDGTFPGSEFKPRPTPDSNWDNRPNTQSPPTSSTTAATAASTDATTTATAGTPATPKVTKDPTQTPPTAAPTDDSSTTIGTTTTTEGPSPSAPTLGPTDAPIEPTSVPITTTTTFTQAPIDVTTTSAGTPAPSDAPTSTAATPQPTDATITTTVTPAQTDGTTTTTSGFTPKVTTITTTTDAPTTQQPTTDAPTTQEPTTDAPTTQHPSTDAPTTQQPTTDAPTTQQPTTDAPTTQQPTTDAPTTQQPTTDAPTQTTASTTPAPTASPAPITTSTATPSTTTTIPTTLSTQAPTTSTPASTTYNIPPEKCKDTADNCAGYGQKACDNPVYRPYLLSHCPVFCGWCVEVTATPPPCLPDRLANCPEYDGGDLCTSDTYYGWSRKNCFTYCGYGSCATTTKNAVVTTATIQPTTATTTTEATNATCADKSDRCNYYDDDQCVGTYAPWAQENCAKRCGYCPETYPCIDVSDYCDVFPAEICTSKEYRGWARTNCRKFCNMCTNPAQMFSSTTAASLSGNGTTAAGA